MANKVLDWVWAHSQSRHSARLVLLSLADSTKTPGGWTWPSIPSLMARTGLKERAVQTAIIELAKMGELEVTYNGGPKGCNRYRVLMTPAESAPPQSLRGADSAPPQDSRGPEGEQVNGQDPANFAPPADSAPPQNSTETPANFAPGTLKEPSNNRSKDLRPKRDLNEGRDDVMRLCVHLADRVEVNAGERPGIGKRWLDAARLMLDNDKRTEQQVHTAIDWCQDSEFWWKNVMSMPKLREQYVRLRAEAQAEQKRGQNGAHGNAAAPQQSAADQRIAEIDRLRELERQQREGRPSKIIPGRVE